MAEFLFATGIECSYPTIDGGRWRVDELESTGHYRYWRRDLELVRELGLRYLRYGPPYYRVHLGPGKFDWSFVDEVAHRMQELEIVPMMDLCHFGVPDWLENFQNPEFPEALAEYAGAFARRYPWVKFYTPVNEMYVTARGSTLDGWWNEQLRTDQAYVRATLNLARASALAAQAITRERPEALFVNSESSELYQPCCPDPRIRRIADFENQRRFIALDLLYGVPLRADVYCYMHDHGMSREEYDWFYNQDVSRRAILGVDYYTWNEKLINVDGNPESLGELFGWYVIASQYYDRYKRPVMHTETNMQDADAAPAWLWRQWHNVQLIRNSGVPVIGFTWYSLQDQVDWDVGLRRALGNVNPCGLFDLNRDPRPVAQAYKHLIEMYGREPFLQGADVLELR
jgi:beta-glucosidase/6-phospho-beta-glucosidase/beta-galactosidase